MRLAKESALLILIGSLDLYSTLAWVGSRGAQEANPVFQYYLMLGPFWFIVMKMVLLIGPLFLLEWAERRRPRSARMGARFAIVAYLALYVVGVARLNPQLLRPHHDAMVAEAPVTDEALASLDRPRSNIDSGTALAGTDSAIVYEGFR